LEKKGRSFMKKPIKKRTLLNSIFLFIAGSLALSCNTYTPEEKPLPDLTPNYLLSGTFSASVDYLDYFDIGNGEYGVAINDTFISGSAINIPATYTVSETDYPVTGIMARGFYNISASVISIPIGIKTIDFEAFLYFDVQQIVIPYTVNRIGDAAFYGSTVENVAFVNSNAEDAGSACSCETPPPPQQGFISSSLTTIPSFCFFHCKNLESISFPASLTTISEEAFNGCSSLASTLAFQSITTIRARAFEGCIALRKIHISKSMFANADGVGIEPHAFNYCAAKNVLDFYFYGTSAKISAWLTNHPNWGWYSDRGNPTTDSYIIRDQIDGSTIFTSDWTYTCDEETKEVTITAYNGPAPTNGYISIPDHMPTPTGNNVTKIGANVFDAIKGSIERLYLPTTLVEIGNIMFKTGWNKLYVVDDNTACKTDSTKSIGEITGRINLSGLDDLEYIGTHAFAGKNMGIGTADSPVKKDSKNYYKYKELITELRLPAHLRAIGDEAFGVFGQGMFPSVRTFTWDYDENSRLEVVGTDCFFALGIEHSSGDIKGNTTWSEHYASTLIFPKTFRYFGMTSKDKTDFNNGALYERTFNFNVAGETIEKGARPSHAFEGCSLIGRVIFKGGADSSNLIIPLQTFVYSESLRDIVFEERPGKYIAFHTQQGDGSGGYSDYAQESIGGNSGRDKNDFRGEPCLQSIFLPNKTTTLYIQRFAFHANARATMYFSGNYGENMYADATRFTWPDMITGNYTWAANHYDVDDPGLDSNNKPKGATQWRTIGNEDWYSAAHNAKYYGYCFTSGSGSQVSNLDSLNTFSLDQKIPYYDNVCYEDTYSDDYIAETDITFGAGNSRKYTVQNKCSFICETKGGKNVATMTNYLFNIRDGSTSDALRTCTIPQTVTVGSTDYTVTEIGESAFSSCFCNGQDTKPTVAVDAVDNVRTVVMPDTIEKIGDYAFIRAYALSTIKSYEEDALPSTATERMPKSLEHIGKNAFIFSGIQKVLKIPFACTFYENETDNYKITSVFANAVSLRKVTFINWDAVTPTEQTYSNYYVTTTYTATTGGDTYTSAIYSTDDSDLSYKKDRLLVVLNRNANDRKITSANHLGNNECTAYGSSGVKFTGLKSNPFLYGAYKMGYWIKQIDWNNNATVNGEITGTLYAQALFSAVGKYSNNEFIDDYIFLGEARTLYSGLACSLESVTGITDVGTLPKYGFDGCEQLKDVNLPNQNGATMPDGVFINGGDNVNYKTITPASSHGADAGYLDLTGTGYSKVGKEAFKNNPTLTNFIAPSNSFTVGESAFASCSNLTTLDFSKVTGTLTIEANAFNSSKITTITWPTSADCKVVIKDGAFSSCKSLTSVTLPSKLSSNGTNKELGSNVFNGCTSLTTVTGTEIDITKLGNNAFKGCTALTNFDFGAFKTTLATIGEGTFQGAGVITNSGNISLPSNITAINKNAFNSSKIVTMTINSNTISLGESAFNTCTSLTAFRFSNTACAWSSYSNAVFNNCTALTELQLPTNFQLSKNFANTNFIKNDSAIEIYSYTKYTNGTTAHASWRTTSTGIFVEVHYYVTSVQDLIDGTVVGGDSIKNTIKFWTRDSQGRAVELGTVLSYSNGVVSFTLDGTSVSYALSETTFSPALP
jgi:hypothetical protein